MTTRPGLQRSAYTPSDYELQILRPHALVGRLGWLASRRALALTPLLSIAVFLLAAAADERLIQHPASGLLCGDLQQLLSANNPLCGAGQRASQLYASRDVLGVIVICIFPLTLPLMLSQWFNISRFIAAMDDRNILTIKDRAHLQREVDQCNRYFEQMARFNGVVVVASVLCMTLVVQAQATGPVYPLYRNEQGQHGIEPTHWWLALPGSTFPSALYFMIGFIGIYVIILQNIHGSRVVLLIWRLRGNVKYGADPSNGDGAYGWSEVSNILFATWSLMIVHGVCLALVSLSLPTGALFAIFPLLGQWLIVTPFYLSVPIWLTARNLRRWKRVNRAELQTQLATATPGEQGAILNQLKAVGGVKVNPYAGSVRLVFLYLGNLGSIVLVYQVLHYIYR